MKRRVLFLGAIWCALTTAWAGAPVDPVEVKFCPAATARVYPLDTMRGANGVLLQNVAVINRSAKPVTIEAVEVALQSGGQPIDTRRFAPDALAKFAKGGQAAQASGMLKLAAFQFCGTDLLGDAQLSGTTTLAPGAALLIMHQPFAFQGTRDRLAVTVYAGTPVARVGYNSLALAAGFAKTDLIFPLAGAWYVASGPSFHTQHRWAIPEEFGLDLLKLDANGKTHRGDGTKFTDYHAYGATIVAPAAGKVVMAITTEGEDPKAMRQKNETQEAYFERLLSDQAARIAGGTPAIIGNGVMIDHGNGEFSMLAHLKPGSVKVAVDDTVTKGQVIGALGSSGNSSEPHLHYQLCDKPDPLLCTGIPLAFSNIDIPLTDLPRPIQSGDVIVTR
jgi:murein DD-endopeptidase MepM/ murein hydrolase activator NlpD